MKIVICDRPDFDWAVEIVRAQRLHERCPVLFSAAFGQVNPTDLAAWILESQLSVRLQLQLHKLIWPGRERGI